MSEFEEGLRDKAEDDEEAVVAAMLDLKKKKKKKKTKVEDTSTEEAGQVMTAAIENDPPPYTYPQLLQRVVDLLHQHNPELAEKKRATIKPPNILRLGTKKTLWVRSKLDCKLKIPLILICAG